LYVKDCACFHEIASDQFCDPANVTAGRRGGKALWLVEPLGFDKTRISCPAEAGCPCFLQGLPDESHPCFSLEGSSHQNRFAASLLRDLDVCSLICLYLKQGVCHARESWRKSVLGLGLLELSFSNCEICCRLDETKHRFVITPKIVSR
jgi:hypothetical protein